MENKPTYKMEQLGFYAMKGSVLPLIKSCMSPEWYKQACKDFYSGRDLSHNFGMADSFGNLIAITGWYKPDRCPENRRCLSYFCVDPVWHGTGLGRWVFDWTWKELWVRGIEELEIHCSDDLPKGMSFYPKVGCSILPKYKASQRLGKGDYAFIISTIDWD